MGITFEGKPFDPDDFIKVLKNGVQSRLAEDLRGKAASIRDPQTGEFSVVVASPIDKDGFELRIEGSSHIIDLIKSSFASGDDTGSEKSVSHSSSNPIVFFSFAYEDHAEAEVIANELQKNGITTWWADWEIRAGDSLPQKINEGLEGCTHFLVLLTPNSLHKPWVQREMDAALMRQIQAKAIFIPLRRDVLPSEMPPLLQALNSPDCTKLNQLISDIHGVSRRPSLGPRPATLSSSVTHAFYSQAANSIAKFFVERSSHALWADPQISVEDILNVTGLSSEDVDDGLHELGRLLDESQELGSHVYYAQPELFVIFDGIFREWKPEEDGLRLAADLVNDPAFPNSLEEISDRYHWPARRLNVAAAFLINRKLVDSSKGLGSGCWAAFSIFKTSDTRRFVKSRSL